MNSERIDRGDALVERLRQLFELDGENGLLRRKITTSSNSKAGSIAGSPDGWGYLRVLVDGKRYLVHRLIYLMANGSIPEQIDHIDGDKLNNRPGNLRQATCQQNQMNRALQSNSTSGVKGVTWNKRDKCWRAHCGFNGKKKEIGRFKTAKEAALAVRTFREQHHKEFARHE